ncbi:hypothetical protein M758_3G099700 [Ceratodon purpureus]|uniref:HSF-type DNA-binding domain-containing protein n=1 Tax=Ceratodon purpureus TaxID=3225 RepID=A0A8T0II16_CERPU|nr:hypothetical protein KC19_3G096600 [Ceratodon purpureus]KAG0622469.1 hypothetical protein M758_3G099700 [Ceratodon purpureus]
MSLSLDTTCTEGASLLTYDCHRTVPAPFLTKTYHLVDDPATDDIVSWGEDETTFVVWRPPEFARDLLPNYFKHNNFSSFVRQLNTYGFRKIVPDHWEFANKFFRRGEKQLLCEIHRRKSSQYGSGNTSDAPGSQSTSPTNSGEDQAWSPFPSPLSSPSTILMPQGASTLLSDENERLRHDNRMLLLELSRLRRLYDDLVVILQQQSKVSLQELPSPLSRLHTLTDHKLSSTISEQIEAAARRSELRELNSLRFSTNKDTPGPRLRPPSVESASCIGLLTSRTHLNRSDSATPKASTLSFLDGKLREMASGMASHLTPHLASNSSQRLPTSLPDDSPLKSSPAPKLFGVSLNNKSPSPSWQDFSPSTVPHKRPRASSWGPDGEAPSTSTSKQGVDPAATKTLQVVRGGDEQSDQAVVLQRVEGSGSKSMKVELGLELRPSREESHPSSEGGQPWLRISATSCAERVFM